MIVELIKMTIMMTLLSLNYKDDINRYFYNSSVKFASELHM